MFRWFIVCWSVTLAAVFDPQLFAYYGGQIEAADGAGATDAAAEPAPPAEQAAPEPAAGLAEFRQHIQRGRYGEASDLLAALPLASLTADWFVWKSRLEVAEGQRVAAITTLQQAVTRFPEDAAVLAELAWRQLERGDLDAAQATAEQAVKLAADQPRARLVLAHVLRETGQYPAASDAYRWFVRYYNKTQPTDAESLLLVAEGSLQYARWNKSTKTFSFIINTLCPDALKADPDCWQAHELSGGLLLEKYNTAQAVPELNAALAINPRAASVLAKLGDAAAVDEDWAKVREFANRALAIAGDDLRAHQLLVAAELDAEDRAAARTQLAATLPLNPRDQLTQALAAQLMVAESGRPPRERFAALLQRLGDGPITLDDQSTALERLVADITHRNPRPATFLTEIGMAFQQSRQHELAELCYSTAIRLNPLEARPRTELGQLYVQIGRLDEARATLNDAFQADPFHVRVSNLRKVLGVLEGYDTIESEHFLIRFDAKEDRLLAEMMSEYLEELYPQLVARFGYEPTGKTQFELFHNAKGLAAHQWFSARMVGLPWVQTIGASTGMIVALTSPTAMEDPYNWAKVVAHEFTHVLTLQGTGFQIPHWYTEALAMRVEEFSPPSEWDQMLVRRVRDNNLRNLSNLNLGFQRARSKEEWDMAYCQSQSYADYLEARFGDDILARLLIAYRDGLSTQDAIPQVTGISLAEFEQGYRDRLETQVAELTAIPSLFPTESARDIEAAYRANPADPQKIAAFAFVELRSNRRKSAKQLAQEALKLQPKQPLALLILAELEPKLDQATALIEQLEQALDWTAPQPELLGKLLAIRLSQKDPVKIMQLASLGRKFAPREPRWLVPLAATWIQQGNLADAKALLEELCHLTPNDPEPARQRARLAAKDEDYPKLAEFAWKILAVDVRDVEGHRLLGRARAALRDWSRARIAYTRATSLDPQDAATWAELARCEAELTHFDAARAAIAKARTLEPNHPEWVARESDYAAAKNPPQ